MIMPDVADNEVIMGGQLEEGKFSIKESAKAFAILSSSLYKNKIKAIIREISCNARDSRIAAGLDQSFTVHLPTRLEPEFSVKDQGIGLTHEEVMHLYTTYFESTKTTSNKFIGALGLGSKSPFAYTENFTITAVKDGQLGVYSAFINATGVPSIVLLHKQTTTEHNGVEITIPVAEKDHKVFSNEASEVYRWFDTRPKTNIPISYRVSMDNAVTKEKHFSFTAYGTCRILMGGVSYPFDMSDFIDDSVLINFIFAMDIGQVDVLPSREGLQNTAKTKQAIISEYNRIIKLTEADIVKEIDQIVTKYDRICFLNNASDNILTKWIKRTKIHKLYFPKNDTAITFDNISGIKLTDYNLKCHKYGNMIGWRTPKIIQSDSTWPSEKFSFIFNDNNSSIKTVKDSYAKNLVWVFSAIDKSIPVDIEKFSKEVLFDAKVIRTKTFTPKKIATISTKSISSIMVAVRRAKVYYSEASYKMVRLGTDTYNSDVKFYIRLNSQNLLESNGHILELDDVVKVVNVKEIIFLKKSSKVDVSGLQEFSEYMEPFSKDQKLSKYYFNGYQWSDSFNNMLTFIKNCSLKIEDAELLELSNEFHSFSNKTVVNFFPNRNAAANYVSKNPKIYPETRLPYDQKAIDTMVEKYDMITWYFASSRINMKTKQKLSEVTFLLNSIHTYSKV
jgi:hypothetical protein